MIALPQGARGADHPSALGREEPRDLGSDAAGGAGHHHDLAVELFHLYLARLIGAAFPYRSPRVWGPQPLGGPAARPAAPRLAPRRQSITPWPALRKTVSAKGEPPGDFRRPLPGNARWKRSSLDAYSGPRSLKEGPHEGRVCVVRAAW